MKMKTRTFSYFLLFAVVAVSLTAFNQPGKKPWVVPEKDAAKKNPLKADANSLKEGKALWSKNCQSCHGKNGAGDGPKAAQLKTEPESFVSAEVQKQSDGSFFYKISNGRGDMPSFKKKLEGDDDVWNLVNYVRTFKK